MIYPKALDGIALFLNLNNSIPFVVFGYSVYENVNVDTILWDSAYTIKSYVALSEFTYTYIQDKNDNDKVIQLTIECGGYTFILNDGEYWYNGAPLDLTSVITQIETTLNF
jgi:hypothetical protein